MDDLAETLNLALLEGLRDRVAAAGDAPGVEFDAWVLELLQGYRLLRGTGRITAGEQRLILEVMRGLETRHGAPRDQVPAQPQRYIASYPRSGNTMTLGMLKALTPVLTTSDMRDSKLCTMPALERPGFPALLAQALRDAGEDPDAIHTVVVGSELLPARWVTREHLGW